MRCDRKLVRARKSVSFIYSRMYKWSGLVVGTCTIEITTLKSQIQSSADLFMNKKQNKIT